MERRLKTPDLFKFPYFEAISWYVAKNLLKTLRGETETKNKQPLPPISLQRLEIKSSMKE